MFLHISSGGQDENEIMRWLDVNDGFLVINAMHELGLQPSRMSLEALVDGCAALNDSEQAHRVSKKWSERVNILGKVLVNYSQHMMIVEKWTLSVDLFEKVYPVF